MTNENLKVGDVAEAIEFMERLDGFYDMDLSHHIAAIKSQQSRIELLESAIREFLYKPNTKDSLGANVHVETLRNLMENKS